MLVKAKRTLDGRWNLHALSGGHYGQTIAVVEAFYMRNAEFGDLHITGDLHGTWGVEISPDIIGTTTEKYLMVKEDSTPLPVLEHQTQNQDMRWIKPNGETFRYKESIPHITGDSHDVWFSYKWMESPLEGVPVKEVR